MLVDFHSEVDQSTCLNLQQALSNTLTLLHSIAGPTRMPFFGLFVLSTYPEVNRLLKFLQSLNALCSLSIGVDMMVATCIDLRALYYI